MVCFLLLWGYSEISYLLFPLIISLSSMSTCFCPTLRDVRLIKRSEFETRGTRRSASISSSLMNSYDSVSWVISAECSSQSRRRTLGHGDRYGRRDRVGLGFFFLWCGVTIRWMRPGGIRHGSIRPDSGPAIVCKKAAGDGGQPCVASWSHRP